VINKTGIDIARAITPPKIDWKLVTELLMKTRSILVACLLVLLREKNYQGLH
jgi:hypothetical protein